MAITRHTTRSKDHVLGRALIHYSLFTHLVGVFLPWVVLTTQGPNLNDNITKIAVHFLMASRIFTNYFGIENYKHNNLSTFNIHWRNLMPVSAQSQHKIRSTNSIICLTDYMYLCFKIFATQP